MLDDVEFIKEKLIRWVQKELWRQETLEDMVSIDMSLSYEYDWKNKEDIIKYWASKGIQVDDNINNSEV